MTSSLNRKESERGLQGFCNSSLAACTVLYDFINLFKLLQRNVLLIYTGFDIVVGQLISGANS